MNRKRVAIVALVGGAWHWWSVDSPDVGGGPLAKVAAIRAAEDAGYEIETEETVAAALHASRRTR